MNGQFWAFRLDTHLRSFSNRQTEHASRRESGKGFKHHGVSRIYWELSDANQFSNHVLDAVPERETPLLPRLMSMIR